MIKSVKRDIIIQEAWRKLVLPQDVYVAVTTGTIYYIDFTRCTELKLLLPLEIHPQKTKKQVLETTIKISYINE